MTLDKNRQYVYRVGSDTQHRLFWDGAAWCYEMLAGGVLFDEQKTDDENQIEDLISVHGLTLDRFSPEADNHAEQYSQEVKEKKKDLEARGIQPCPKHGIMARNRDGTCEACEKDDYPDDMKGTEG